MVQRYKQDTYKSQSDSLNALRMRKFISFAMFCLLCFFVLIELELDASEFLPQNIPLPKISFKKRSKRFSFSNKNLVKRYVHEIPTGFIPTWSGEYKVRLFHSSPDFTNWNFHDVTLVTQCSVNRLYNLKELSFRWNGPISIAVFIPGQEAGFAFDAIEGLKKCYPDTIAKQVSFHLAYPSNHEADISGRNSLEYKSCQDLLKIIENYGEANYEHSIPYPHNVLRNAARNGVTTEFVFLIDVDVLPSIDLRSNFIAYAHRNNLIGNKKEKRVYVVPVFEIKQGYPVPMTKRALLDANADGLVRPFHNVTCWWCHKPERHEDWLKLANPNPKQLGAGFIADWEKSWEPFYIARRNVPLFDERFKQYGYDRIEQICELHLMNYDFVVLDKAFLIHRGWKEFTKDERKKETYIMLVNYLDTGCF